MKKTLLNGFIFFSLFQPIVWAQSIVFPVDPKDSSIVFVGKTTFHDFRGRVGTIRGHLVFNSSQPLAQGRVEVDILSFDTGNKERDKNMDIMFNAQIYPLVSFDINKADFSQADKHEVEMQGTLSMHGISRPFDIMAQVIVNKNGYVCQGIFPISLKEFGLKPPSILGLIKVTDQVQIQFNVAFHNMI
jgi:polyisoprenoid-binding protein YceI